jgi:hypothetical protein
MSGGSTRSTVDVDARTHRSKAHCVDRTAEHITGLHSQTIHTLARPDPCRRSSASSHRSFDRSAGARHLSSAHQTTFEACTHIFRHL